MFSVPHLEVPKKAVLRHSLNLDYAKPCIGLTAEPLETTSPVRAASVESETVHVSWQGHAIRGCAYLPEVALYVVVGSVLAWEPASGQQPLLSLTSLMLLVVALPWFRQRTFPRSMGGETLPIPDSVGPAAGASVDPRSTGLAARRALHRDAQFGP